MELVGILVELAGILVELAGELVDLAGVLVELDKYWWIYSVIVWHFYSIYWVDKN